MRPDLIDFLIEAHAAYSMIPETLFLAVNLLDRYCSTRNQIPLRYFQLVGCVTLSIAAKYCDKKCNIPRVHELQTMCAGIYERSAFPRMEMHILESLGWIIGHPTAEVFAQLFAVEQGDDDEVKCMAAYLREIALYHRSFISNKPSAIARTSLALARTILDRTEADSGDEEETMISNMLSHHIRRPSLIVARKYSDRNFCQVSQKLAKFVSVQAIPTRRIVHVSIPHVAGMDKHTAGLASS